MRNEKKKRRLSQAMLFILLFGVVSLFSDMTHEGASSIRGAYLTLLGASSAAIGFVSGLGELIGYSMRYVFGKLTDRTRQYWTMTILGYVLDVLAVPALALVGEHGWLWACALLVVQRMGKAIKKPAKDTIMSFAATQEGTGKSFGLQELLDQIGATDLPPVTSNGVTLTPLAAVADEHTLYLRLRLEAPEGTVLPDMGEQEDHIAHDVELVDADTGERLNWGMQKARFLPDDTPGDNSLELVFMLLGGPNGANWVDGTSKTLTITGLILCPREPEDAGKTYLEGEWSFSLDSFYQGKEVEINTIGAVRWDEETERMVTLEGLTLSPLAASYTISYPVEESWEFVDLQLELVYKDGSSVTIDGGGGKGSHGPDGQGGTDYFTGVRNFDAPLDLRELDHLQYGGCRLEIPGEPRAVVEADTAEAVWYDETHQNTLVLEKLSFSSLSLTYRMHYDTPESATLADTGIRLVLADGTEIPVDGGSGSRDSHGRGRHG